MRRLAKKFAASVLALTLVVAMGTQCFAATWSSYFGASEGWYEGATGSLTQNTATAFTANIDTIGWGGVWGAQVRQDKTLNIKKGQKYTLSFTMTSSKINHFVYIKVATGETVAYNAWVQLKAGKAYKFNQTFTAKADADTISFGMGGDAGDRIGVSTEPDAEIRYAALPNYQTLLAGADFTAATQIKVTNYKLTEAKPAKVKLSSVKANGGKKVTVKFKKISGIKKYQIQYSYKSNMKSAKNKTTTKATYALKRLKKGKKVYVRVRAVSGKLYGDWSAKRSVKVK